MANGEVETREQKFKRLFPWMDPGYASGPWSDPEEYDLISLPGILAIAKADFIARYVTPYGLPWLPGYILKDLVDISKLPDSEWAERLKKTGSRMATSHLADIAAGRINVKDNISYSMPEEVCQKCQEVLDTPVAVVVESKPKSKKESNKDTAAKPVKKTKVPVYLDKAVQGDLTQKYPWAIGFRQDQDKAGGTIVDVKCVICSDVKSVYLYNVYQCKMCKACKGKNAKTINTDQELGGQSDGQSGNP
jgi:hypothetical protein